MNINLTLVGETVTFALFVWFCMKFVWPPIVEALQARRLQIADGLAAAERGHHELELAGKRGADLLREAKVKAAEIVTQGQEHCAQIIDEAKAAAVAEGERQLAAARAEIEHELLRARERLRGQVGQLVIAAAAKVVGREVDADRHADLVAAITQEL